MKDGKQSTCPWAPPAIPEELNWTCTVDSKTGREESLSQVTDYMGGLDIDVPSIQLVFLIGCFFFNGHFRYLNWWYLYSMAISGT
jgi:hypothetical protein